MPRFTIWYKKVIDAKNINECIKREKKAKLDFDSITQDNAPDREMMPCIGFEVSTESDYPEDDDY